MSGYFSGSFHNLFHSKADSVSKVKDIALSAVSQIVHSQNMCLSEVIDMDIIPYAGAIFCIIIRTENGNILSLVVRYLKYLIAVKAEKEKIQAEFKVGVEGGGEA